MLEMVNDGYTIYSEVGMAGAERRGRGQGVIKGKDCICIHLFSLTQKKPTLFCQRYAQDFLSLTFSSLFR